MVQRRLVFAALANFTWIFVFVLGVEGYVRLVEDDGMQFDLEMWKYARDVKRVSDDPLIGHEHAPNRQARLMGVEVRTNSRGLREREIPYERTPGHVRVLMLGDSLTFGWGTRVQETFSKRVEARFIGQGQPVEVVNTGVGNYNTVQEVQYFLVEGHKYQPDIVVLNFFVNDAEPVPRPNAPSAITRYCYACNFLAGRIDAILRQFSGRKNWAGYYLSLYEGGQAKGWLDAKAAMRRLASYCQEKGIALLIANLPELHDVKNYPLHEITGLVRNAAEENGAAFVDVLPYLESHKSTDLWVTSPDPHPNGLAHRLIADGLLDALSKLMPAR